MTKQLYYEFSRHMNTIKTDMSTSNSSLNRGTQKINREVQLMREELTARNRMVEQRLFELKKILGELSTY